MSTRKTLAITIYLLACAFYLYEFALQVAPSVMVTELMYDLNLDSVGIGWLAAAYYYAYAPMQIPAGILFDKFGARWLISVAIMMCVLGTFFFAGSQTIQMASLGRFLVGIGSAFSFVGILVLISNWFQSKYYALLVGIAQLLSSVGVISGQYVLAKFITLYGWRAAMIKIALSGLLLAVGTWFIIQDEPVKKEPKAKKAVPSFWQLIEIFMAILARPQTWFIAFYAFLSWGPMTFFSSLWAVEYLKAMYSFTTEEALKLEMVLWIGVAIGCPLMGGLSNYVKRRVLPMTSCVLAGLLASIVMINMSEIPMWLMIILLGTIGFAAAGQTISFGLVRDINFKDNLGSASGFNNMATVAGGAILQPIIGLLMRHYWNGAMSNGAPYYDLYTFQKALILLPICYSLALFLTLTCIKESRCQPID